MSTFVKVGGAKFPASIDGNIRNLSWDNRESKAITLTATYAEAESIFADGTVWSIVQEYELLNEDGTTSPAVEEYDNAAFSVLGDIVVHANGTCTVNMGKPTDLEDVLEQLYGGVL